MCCELFLLFFSLYCRRCRLLLLLLFLTSSPSYFFSAVCRQFMLRSARMSDVELHDEKNVVSAIVCTDSSIHTQHSHTSSLIISLSWQAHTLSSFGCCANARILRPVLYDINNIIMCASSVHSDDDLLQILSTCAHIFCFK